MKPDLPGLLITRPTDLARPLAERVRNEGGQAWIFPTLAIHPLPLDEEATRSRVRQADWAIFISANAVQEGWPHVGPHLKPSTRLAAVGEATAARLGKISALPVLHPLEGADSEALLALPELGAPAGQHMLIVRGKGGREHLREVLTRRGAQVDYLECYVREAPVPDLLLLDDALGHQAMISVQSAESLHNLWQLAGESRHERLKQTHFLVPHVRVAEAAHRLGLSLLHLTGPGEDALVNSWKNLRTQDHE